MTVPTAAIFDEWYKKIIASVAYDPFVTRALELPATVESTGYLSGPGLLEVQAALALLPGQTLVDLGCGLAGYSLDSIASTGATLIGVDFSAAALRAAQATAARLGLADRARFRNAGLTDTGLPAGSADAVLSVDAFHFADSTAAAANEAARLLRPGGRIVITTWQAADSTAARRLPERIGRMDIERDLAASGLRDVQILDRPAWSRTEISFWRTAAELDPGDDPAMAALREEALVFLPLADALRRLLVVARR